MAQEKQGGILKGVKRLVDEIVMWKPYTFQMYQKLESEEETCI